VLLLHWWILRNNLQTVREVRHVCFYELCDPASSGGQIGALRAVFFLRAMTCVTKEIRFSIRK